MAPDGACGVAQSTARSNANFEAERFRKRFRKGFRWKRESVVESNDACSSHGSEGERWGGVCGCCRAAISSGWVAAERGRAVISSVAEHEKACSSSDFERQDAPRHARAAISSGRWLRSAAEQ